MIYEVSILVPIYDVSDYIERCAKSIFEQTFDSIEYIFVNDCTPDDSIQKLLKVIEQYPQRKNDVKIINHAINRGIAATRNTAFDNSTGKYILYVDSDDYIENDMVELLYKKIISEGSEVAVSDVFLEYSQKAIIKPDLVVYNHEENLLNMISQKETFCSVWNKLVIRTLYEKDSCRFKEGLNYFDDRYVVTRLYYYAQKIAKVNKPLYHYVQYAANSITKSKNKMHFENVILFWELTDDFLKEKNIYEKYQPAIELSKVKNKASLMLDVNSYSLRKEYADMFRSIEKKYTKYLRLGERIMLLLLRLRLYRLAQIFRQLLWHKNN